MTSEPSPSSVRRRLSVLAAALLSCGASLSAQQVLVSPALPTTQDRVVLVASLACNPIDPPTIAGHTVTLAVTSPLRPCPAGAVTPFYYTLPPLEAGSYTVRWLINGFEIPQAVVFQVVPPTTGLGLLAGRYRVTATFTDPVSGAPREAQAVQLGDESGYFWFFDPANVEITAKVLDGHAVNDRAWVFLASMTTVGFTVKVTDLQTPPNCGFQGATTPCLSKTYTSRPGTNQNFFDLQTFR